MAQLAPSHRTGRRIAAVAGSALLASALLAGLVGCTPTSHVTITREGVTIDDGTDVKTVPFYTSDASSERSITVSGIGSVNAVPDTAEVSLGVVAQAADAATAQKDAAATVDAVTQALEKLGIDPDSISTTDVYLNPQYDYSSSTEKITGYQMNVAMTVKDLSIEQAGAAIGAATAAGASRVNGVSYYCSDYDALYQKALAAALSAAEAKAQGIADASGDTLGAALSVVEGYESQAYRNESAKAVTAAGVAYDAAADEADLGLDPGAVQIRATVTVEYAVRG